MRINNLTGLDGGDHAARADPAAAVRHPRRLHRSTSARRRSTCAARRRQQDDPLEHRELDVRASDGSNFAFNDTTILFRAIPGKADETLRDSGLGHAYYEWMLPYARAILRDEFGRESTIERLEPDDVRARPRTRAKKRLNKLLGEHGIEVTSIVTPRPRFSKDYEDLIEARNQAENQLAVIDSELAAREDRARPQARRGRARSEQGDPDQARRARVDARDGGDRADADAPRGRLLQDRQGRGRRGRAVGVEEHAPTSSRASSTPSTSRARPRSTRSATSRSSA